MSTAEKNMMDDRDEEVCTVHKFPTRPTDGGCQMRTRIEVLERNDERMLKDLNEIKDILGESPDHAQGTSGRGMARTLSRIAEVVLKDEDEGECTLVQSRSELLARVRSAEAALEAHRQESENRNKLSIETGKLKIEKWKLAIGLVSVLFGPSLVSFILQHFFK